MSVFSQNPNYGSSAGANVLQSQQIYIPNELIGCIIGKGGSKINEIRQQSGCQVKIGELSLETNERLITLTGTAEATQIAFYLIYTRLQSERQRLGLS